MQPGGVSRAISPLLPGGLLPGQPIGSTRVSGMHSHPVSLQSMAGSNNQSLDTGGPMAQKCMEGYDWEHDGHSVICMEAPVEVEFQPCSHTVACVRCAQKITARANECPMCRAGLQSNLLLPCT